MGCPARHCGPGARLVLGRPGSEEDVLGAGLAHSSSSGARARPPWASSRGPGTPWKAVFLRGLRQGLRGTSMAASTLGCQRSGLFSQRPWRGTRVSASAGESTEAAGELGLPGPCAGGGRCYLGNLFLRPKRVDEAEHRGPRTQGVVSPGGLKCPFSASSLGQEAPWLPGGSLRWLHPLRAPRASSTGWVTHPRLLVVQGAPLRCCVLLRLSFSQLHTLPIQVLASGPLSCRRVSDALASTSPLS